MEQGVFSGLFWATDTVLIHNVSLDNSTITILPVLIACLHDFISVLIISIILLLTTKIRYLIKDIKSKGSKYIALAAILGGPIGLTAYIISIHYLGTYFACVITSLYPAIGTLLARVFINERRNLFQWLALMISIISVMALGFEYDGVIENIWIGLGAAIICTLSWGSEAVICSWTLSKYNLKDTSALWIRQTSAAFIGLSIITLIMMVEPFNYDDISFLSHRVNLLCMAAICGALSYFFYYSAIHKIGASRAMAVNSSYSGFAILINYFMWNIIPTLEELILGILIVGGGIISAYDYKK